MICWPSNVAASPDDKASGAPHSLSSSVDTSRSLPHRTPWPPGCKRTHARLQYALLATDGMLVKRPLLVGDDFVLTGFKGNEWKEKLL